MTALLFSKMKNGYSVRNNLQKGKPVVGYLVEGKFISAEGRRPSQEVINHAEFFARRAEGRL